MLASLKKIFPQEIQHKLYRYLGVSLFNVLITQSLLWAFSQWVSDVWANVIAVCLAALPAFFLYKQWVWKHSEKAKIKKEVLLFWILALIGLGFSTFTVWLATLWWDNFWSLALANLSGFGIVWVGKFIFFESYLFKIPKR